MRGTDEVQTRYRRDAENALQAMRWLGTSNSGQHPDHDHAYTDLDRPKQTHSLTRTPPPTQYVAGGTEWRSQDIHTLLNASTGTPMRFGGDCEGTMVTVPGSATHGPELLVMGAIHHTGILIHAHVHPCVTTSPI